jgi:hypothetical protein
VCTRSITRIAWCAAHRLDEHRRADAVRRSCGVRKVIGPYIVLSERCGIRDAIAVERVEGASSQRLGDTDGDVDVVAERLRQCGIGQEPAIAGGHVTGGEVETGQLHTRVLDGADEGGHFGVRRRRRLEGPPKLDRLEAGVSSRARPVQQRQLGQQNRTVDGVGRVHHGIPLRVICVPGPDTRA